MTSIFLKMKDHNWEITDNDSLPLAFTFIQNT